MFYGVENREVSKVKNVNFLLNSLRRCDKAILVLLPARNVDCIFLIDKAGDDDEEEENGARE